MVLILGTGSWLEGDIEAGWCDSWSRRWRMDACGFALLDTGFTDIEVLSMRWLTRSEMTTRNHDEHFY